MTAAQSQGRLRRARSIAPIVAVVVLMSAGTGSALAQGQESRPTAAVQAQSGSPEADGTDGLRSNVGGLPFTGLDLLILAGLSMTLFGSGMALRRLSAPRV